MGSPNIDLQTLLKLLSVFKKLGALKNNLALLVPIIIAIVALLLFIPTTLLSGRLRGTIDKQSVQVSKEIDSLSKKVEQAAEAEALESYIDAYAQDANAMDKLILQSCQRELLSYKLFPDMNETSPLLFEPFRQKFVSGVDAMLQSLGAGTPPSEVEIFAALEAATTRAMNRRSRPVTGRPGQGLNMRFMNENDRRIVAKICEDRARSIKVYANPVDLGGYVYWSEWTFEDWDKAVKDCWYWQMAYWILEDITATARTMNEGADSALNAPVKRIVSAAFTRSQGSRSTIGSRGRRVRRPKDKQTPAYVVNVKTAMTGTPCTGRFTNETRDVMQFEVQVVVRAADVMRFMQELCSAKPHKFCGWRGDQPEQTFQHNQIAILESDIIPVDREDLEHTSYEYGPEEVVSMDLICEYVFNKAAYKDIQPAAVLKDIEDAAAPTTRR